ncbi:MAG: tRNA (adenosine(37)-N6)-threonylcarbamoyltransferase complex ATPase subunit type 1 TsaE [Acutalibacteraceae bacterium]
MRKFISHSVEETEEFAKGLAESVTKPMFIALFGDLGMGKTAFVRGFCEGIGYKGEVTSPTFALIHEYYGGRIDIFHFDMYRVAGYDDLYSTGFFDYLDRGIIITEWSENITEFLPEDCVKITVSREKNDDDREFMIEGWTNDDTCG